MEKFLKKTTNKSTLPVASLLQHTLSSKLTNATKTTRLETSSLTAVAHKRASPAFSSQSSAHSSKTLPSPAKIRTTLSNLLKTSNCAPTRSSSPSMPLLSSLQFPLKSALKLSDNCSSPIAHCHPALLSLRTTSPVSSNYVSQLPTSSTTASITPPPTLGRSVSPSWL